MRTIVLEKNSAFVADDPENPFVLEEPEWLREAPGAGSVERGAGSGERVRVSRAQLHAEQRMRSRHRKNDLT